MKANNSNLVKFDQEVQQLPSTQTTDLIPCEHEWHVYTAMAKAAAQTPFFHALGGEGGILCIMLYAREMNLAPMEALFGGVHNIQGRVELSARIINKKIRESGHKIQVKTLNDQKCIIYGQRRDTKEEMVAEYSVEDAKKAGLIKQGGGWTKNPQDMLFARCISRLGRRLFPDVIGTAYTEGEIQESTSAQQEKPVPKTLEQMAKDDPATSEPVKSDNGKKKDSLESMAEADQKSGNNKPGNGNGNAKVANLRTMIVHKLGKIYSGDMDLMNKSLSRMTLPSMSETLSLDGLESLNEDQLKEVKGMVEIEFTDWQEEKKKS